MVLKDKRRDPCDGRSVFTVSLLQYCTTVCKILPLGKIV